MSGQYELADELFSVLLDRYGRTYDHCLRAGLCKLRFKHYDLAFALFEDAYTQVSTAEAANYCAVSLRQGGKASFGHPVLSGGTGERPAAGGS